MDVRSNILRYLSGKGISLKELSEMSGIKPGKLESVFCYKSDLSVKNYASICKCLNLDISYFL